MDNGSIKQLVAFVFESNRIEGIEREPTDLELVAHYEFMMLKVPLLDALVNFVRTVEPSAVLRDRPGLDVQVGDYVAPPGGFMIRERLDGLLHCITRNASNTRALYSPWLAHVEYEKLHPFMDGNGRSGRALWLWQMYDQNHEVPRRGFLHEFYYQTLEENS
jgi:hypothetical protein